MFMIKGILEDSTKIIAEMTKDVFRKSYEVTYVNTENGVSYTSYYKVNKNERKALIDELNSDHEIKAITFLKNNCVCVM